ncbi:MAG: glycosyltransferase family 4 protein [archaeon]
MKILMYGWEFPPHFSGGLGTACYGITKGLSHFNVGVTFVMPSGPKGMRGEFVKLMIANNLILDKHVKFKKIDSLLTPYMTSTQYDDEYAQYLREHDGNSQDDLYGKDIYQEVFRFAAKAAYLSLMEDFDVIHAHDWMTYPAGIKTKEVTGKPLVVHIHATEFDRTGGNGVNQLVYDIEREGFHKADLVIANSNLIKDRLIHQYGVPAEKIRVVHNAVEFTEKNFPNEKYPIKENDKIVLFLGRVTLQKGPDYFIEAAKKVVDKIPNVKFIIAGSGDMLPRIIHRAAELGISNKVLFPGFVSREEGDKLYRMADLFVMPSVSEPFGIVPLEAMWCETPVIISKQSGVSEVLSHCLKVDFWDIDELANQMIAMLYYSTLHKELQVNGLHEVSKMNWDIPAQKIIEVYQEVLKHQKVKR